MQLRLLAVVPALWAVPVASLAIAVESDAMLWLQQHRGAPNGDDLAELKVANPQAYAIVKALLAKRSLGLLNPKHPSASFAAPAREEDSTDRSPEAFAKLASPGEVHARSPRVSAAEVSLPYAEVQPATHRDWLNWKPQSSGMDDETMVQNVLGAVAELKSGKKAGLLSKRRQSEDSPLAADEESLATHDEPAPTPMAVSKPAAPEEKKAPAPYMDFGAVLAPKPKATPAQENSYLKGLDLTTDSEKAQRVAHEDSAPTANYLNSFSWDDKADAKPQVAMKRETPTRMEPKVETKETSLASWLGVVKKKPEPAMAPAAQPAAPKNPYLMDLSF